MDFMNDNPQLHVLSSAKIDPSREGSWGEEAPMTCIDVVALLDIFSTM